MDIYMHVCMCVSVCIYVFVCVYVSCQISKTWYNTLGLSVTVGVSLLSGRLMITLQKLFIAAPQDPDTMEDLTLSWEERKYSKHIW